MSQIHIPDALVEQIAAAGLAGGAVDEFVQQAIREKLADQSRRRADERAVDEFDAVCDDAVIFAPGTHLTRDQLHERD